MTKLVLFVALLSSVGCKDEQPKPAKQTDGSAKPSMKDAEARKILVLEAALAKARTELRDLETAQPRDEAAITAKLNAIEAVTQTLAQSRRRFDEMDRRQPQSK
jgi:Spy/CpxP family protein refolding chaperone